MDHLQLARLVDQLAVALLGVVLFQTLTHRLATSIGVIIVQGLLLTTVSVVVAIGAGTPEVYFGAVLTAVVRVILVPALLFSALSRVRVKVENAPVLPIRVALVGAIALTLVAYQVSGAIPLPGALPSTQALPVALALMGLFAGWISQTFNTTNVDHLKGLRDSP